VFWRHRPLRLRTAILHDSRLPVPRLAETLTAA
jgi:hypothetical protein